MISAKRESQDCTKNVVDPRRSSFRKSARKNVSAISISTSSCRLLDRRCTPTFDIRGLRWAKGIRFLYMIFGLGKPHFVAGEVDLRESFIKRTLVGHFTFCRVQFQCICNHAMILAIQIETLIEKRS